MGGWRTGLVVGRECPSLHRGTLTDTLACPRPAPAWRRRAELEEGPREAQKPTPPTPCCASASLQRELCGRQVPAGTRGWGGGQCKGPSHRPMPHGPFPAALRRSARAPRTASGNRGVEGLLSAHLPAQEAAGETPLHPQSSLGVRPGWPHSQDPQSRTERAPSLPLHARPFNHRGEEKPARPRLRPKIRLNFLATTSRQHNLVRTVWIIIFSLNSYSRMH